MTDSPALGAQDRLDILETLHYFSHVIDNRQWDRLVEVVTEDVRYQYPNRDTVLQLNAHEDMVGPAGLRRGYERSEVASYSSTHSLNTVIEPLNRDTVIAWSRLLLVTWEQTAIGADSVDTLVRTEDGWRISRKVVHARNAVRDPQNPGDGYIPGPFTWAQFDNAIMAAQEEMTHAPGPARDAS